LIFSFLKMRFETIHFNVSFAENPDLN